MANGIVNGQFSTDILGWVVLGMASSQFTHDAATGHDAAGSAKIVATGAAAGQGAGMNAVYGFPAAAVGQTWHASVWAKGSGTVLVSIVERTGTAAGTEYLGTPVVLTGEWQELTHTARLTDATTNGVSIRVKTSVAQAATFWFDDAVLDRSVATYPGYIDVVPLAGTNGNAPVVPLP